MIPNKLKTKIKDLNRQIDYLIGYQPQGLHWKLEYHAREKAINDFLEGDQMPDDIKERIRTLRDLIEKAKQGIVIEQPYTEIVNEIAQPMRKIAVKSAGRMVDNFELREKYHKKEFEPMKLETNHIKSSMELETHLPAKGISGLSNLELRIYYNNVAYCLKEEIVTPTESYMQIARALKDEAVKRGLLDD